MGDWTKRFGLKGKHALVTGASKGIGIETCKVLTDAGADIAAVGRDREGLAEVKAAVEAIGANATVIVDVVVSSFDFFPSENKGMLFKCVNSFYFLAAKGRGVQTHKSEYPWLLFPGQ